MMKLLLGGTSDSTAILEVLDRMKIDVTSSVVTDYGRHLASKYGQPVIQGRLTAEDMVAFIKENAGGRGGTGWDGCARRRSDFLGRSDNRGGSISKLP